MKRTNHFSTLFALLLAGGLLAMTSNSVAQSTSPAPTQHGPGFVDENGDGYNDRAPDADGDGIPNGLDPDYTGPRMGRGFIDENNDGLNDWAQDFDGDGIINRFDPDYLGSQNLTNGRGMGRGTHRQFIDTDGDGVNDRFQDFDGDGIINCQDPDWRASMGLGERGGRWARSGSHHGRYGMGNAQRGARAGQGWSGRGHGFGRGFMNAPSTGNGPATTGLKQMQTR